MYAALGLLALLGCVAAKPAILVGAEDDGQWHPELDGSSAGSGLLRWSIEDGSWKPELDGSWQGRGDLAWLNRKRRDVAVDPNSLSQPADEPIVANAKNAQLRQQYTEAQRNIYGGIPQDLPADTPEVAAGKQAHAIAHENEKLATSAARYTSPIHHVTSISQVATPVVARVYTPVATPVAHIATPVAARVYTPVATPVAHIATPVAARVYTPVATPITHVAAPVSQITTVARTLTPVAHYATQIAHYPTPVLRAVSPYHYAYDPVLQVYKKK